jgi:hypothetical protein
MRRTAWLNGAAAEAVEKGRSIPLILLSSWRSWFAGLDAGKTRCTGGRVALAAGLMVLMAGVAASPAMGQNTRRQRRESNANRRARIARTIDQTYSHRWEVGAGGGYERFRSGQYTRQNNEVTFWGSGMYSLTQRFGVVGMAGGGFGSARLGNNPFNAVNPQIQNYDFMAGPSYRLLAKEKYALSVYGTGGAAYGRFSTGPKDFPSTVVGLWPSGTAAAFGAGLNLDYNFYPNLAVRVTPNYVGSTFGSTVQNSKGVNFGIVYRFGHIR